MNGQPHFPMTPDENARIALEAWKKVVQTQEHFNEICMKVRTLYATVLAAILSLYGVFLKDQQSHRVSVSDVSFDPILAICFSIIVVTTLFYFVDKGWYHRLLLGAVSQGAEIERKWKSVLPEIQLGTKISEHSPVDLSGSPKLVWLLSFFVSDVRLKENSCLHSDAKIEVFYKPIRGLAFFVLVLALLFGGVEVGNRSVAGLLWGAAKGICG